jgi:hypothetical protein
MCSKSSVASTSGLSERSFEALAKVVAGRSAFDPRHGLRSRSFGLCDVLVNRRLVIKNGDFVISLGRNFAGC